MIVPCPRCLTFNLMTSKDALCRKCGCSIHIEDSNQMTGMSATGVRYGNLVIVQENSEVEYDRLLFRGDMPRWDRWNFTGYKNMTVFSTERFPSEHHFFHNYLDIIKDDAKPKEKIRKTP